MRQFFVESVLSDGGSASLEGENFRHLSRSLRARTGEPVRLVDPGFRAFQGVIASFSKSAVTVEGLKLQAGDPAGPDLSLGLCMPSSDAFEAALDAAVQLGAKKIVPLASEFSKRPDEKKFPRWQKLIREACCQSLRAVPPELAAAQSLDAYLKSAAGGRKLLAWQGAGGGLILKPGDEFSLVIGPEGGFSEAELMQAKAQAWEGLNLGPHVLRVPVAVAAALGVLQRMRFR